MVGRKSELSVDHAHRFSLKICEYRQVDVARMSRRDCVPHIQDLRSRSTSHKAHPTCVHTVLTFKGHFGCRVSEVSELGCDKRRD